MKNANRIIAVLSGCAVVASATQGLAQDWPQWRGPGRDGKATGFSAPATWPKELSRKWKVTVGQGDATPALVGDKLFVFARQEGREVALCLDAATGKELWREGYDALPATGMAGRHPGPRSSPTVGDGKMITYGVRGTLSCFNAADGKVLWRKDDFAGVWPKFFTASSPLVVGGLCIAQLGGENNGGIVAYDLGSGDQKWKWTGDGAAYSSPVVATIGGNKVAIALTAKNIVALSVADGKLLWESAFAPQGRAYNAATPIVTGSSVIYTGSGRGTKATALEAQGDKLTAKDLWGNTNAVQFDTPVLKNSAVYGIAQNGDFFCIKAQDGSTLWTAASPGGRSGFGSIVDAGSVLIALTPQSELLIFPPSDKEFQKLATYKVADTEIYAYPVLSRKSVYVKDQDSVTLWSIE
jgi:outer membrane protein assembly factor BamB